MSDPGVRIDQLTGLRTLLAPSRADRPFEFEVEPPSSAEAPPDSCPFCEGQEDRTPAEIWADRPAGSAANGPGWRVRAVPNLYPALVADPDARVTSEGGISASRDPLLASARSGEPDLFASAPASGAHEVIVHAPSHRRSLAELRPEELGAAVAGWRARMRAHTAEAAYVQLIVNEGPDAGASLEHTHAQLYALSFVPAAVARERERFIAHHERTMGGDLLADVAAEEVRRRERLVAIDDEALLICPWASRSPFELRIVPRRVEPRFDEDKAGVAMLATALRALGERFGATPQLNLWVRTAPRHAEQFHWHIDISPQLTIRAGFELSTGVEINVYPPERAAAELRDCLPDTLAGP